MKGVGSYTPSVGERVFISGPNHDNDEGYIYGLVEVYWMNDTFILYGNEGYHPNLHKIEHVHIKEFNT